MFLVILVATEAHAGIVHAAIGARLDARTEVLEPA